MKKLDSICSKLLYQNSAALQSGVDASISGTNGDSRPIPDVGDDDTSQKPERGSPSLRVNKRKNFTPKVFRLCEDDVPPEKRKEPTDFEIEGSPPQSDYEEENRKRRRFSASYHDGSHNGGDGDSSDKSNELDHNGPGQRDEERGAETPAMLAIVEPDDDMGTTSGRSSSNRSNSVLVSAGIASASVSPSLLLGQIATFGNLVQCQSPSATPTASATPNIRYVQQRLGDLDSKHTVGQTHAGTGSKQDQQSTPVVSYIVRFMGNDCGAEQCRFSSSREHFHCKLCNNKLFTKKEEMLRHYKWHRKREESLAYGFMRYSASDDCTHHFADCVHNLRQTHYHCLQDGCDKVYISTSDVQMHANSHRKQAHIAKEGFQRVKGSEQCTYAGCPFTDPSNRTTHFHCLRPGCSHSFKNKADMDKHKAHHTRDEQLTRDGFKKYMKSEACSFPGCAFSRIVNHIHCIRPGCDYVLHSTSQMYSHKRKHEKQDKRVNDYVAQQQAIAAAFKNAAAALNAAGMSSSSASSPTSPNVTAIVGSQSRDDLGQLPTVSMPTNGSAENATESFSSPVAKKVAAAIQSRLKLKQYDPQARTFHDAGTLGPNDRPTDCSSNGAKTAGLSSTIATSNPVSKIEMVDPDDMAAVGIDMSTLQSPIQFLKSVAKAEADGEIENEAMASMPQHIVPYPSEIAFAQVRQQQHQPNLNGRNKGDDSWKKFITRYTANDPCVPLCPLLYKDHYHCTAGEGCKMTFKSKDGVRDHAKQHEQLCQAIEHFRAYEADEDCKVEGCPYQRQEVHYHCLWDKCSETIGSSEPVFRRLEHHKVHEYSNQLLSDSRTQSLFAGGSAASTAPKVSTIDGPSASTSPSQAALSASGEVFKRKRGRPPKYNVLDVNVNPSTHIGQSPEILLTSFKLAKGAAGLPSATGQVQPQPQGPVERQQHSPSSQSRRGRPRTVSSPRHASEEMANTVNQTAAAAVALLQQQQAHHLQQQLELLRMWNSSLDSVPAPVPSSPMAETKGDQPSTKRLQFEGFTTYVASENCPDTLCRYRGQHHYHCRLPRCFYSSNRGDQLESHHREFHDAFEIPDGYACYDRWYNCRHTSCQYNGQARHFHCQKAGCSAALLKFNELQVHTSKGHEALSHDQQFGSPAQNSESPEAGLINSANSKTNTSSNHLVRTTGIFYPSIVGSQTSTSAIGGVLSSGPFASPSSTSPSALSLNPATFAALAQSLSPAFAFMNAAAALGVGAGSTSSNLVPGAANGIVGMPSNNSLPYTVEQQCGRPFCKLKRRLHYHCTLCHQGFSHFDRLTVHMQKHGVILPPVLAHPPTMSPISAQQASMQSVVPNQHRSTGNTKGSQNIAEKKDQQLLQPTPEAKGVVVSGASARTAVGQQKKVKFHVFQPKMMKFADPSIPGPSLLDQPKVASGTESSQAATAVPPTTTLDVKPTAPKRPKKSPNPIDKDSTAATSNAISANMTHFKFVDCTADVSQANQLAARSLTSPNSSLTSSNSIQKPPLPQQEAASPSGLDASPKRPVACSDEACSKTPLSSVHYHCEKCEFWTPESTKWHMHVKQHARMDQVAALGFRKVLAGSASSGGDASKGTVVTTISCPLSVDCSLANQSHYHCATCSASALTHSQMSAHKATKHPTVD